MCQFFCLNDQVLFLGWAQGKGKVKLEVLGRVSEEGSSKILTTSSTGAPMGVAIARLAALSPVTP